MKVLVTGTEGQLARCLKDRAGAHPSLHLHFVGRPELDLARPGDFAACIEDVRPALVINAAAYTAVDDAEHETELATRINGAAPGEGAEAAAGVGARFIHLSTDYVYGGEGSAPLTEDEPVAPRNAYGRSKLAGEEAVRAANPAHLILRTAWVVSPYGRNFVRTMMNAAQTRDVLTVVDDQRGSPTSALDLASAILAIADQWRSGSDAGLGQTMHAAGAGETSWCGIAAHVMGECRALGLRSADVRPILTRDWPTPAQRPHWSVLDSSRLQRTFGVTMPDWRGSVSEIVRALASADGAAGHAA